MIDIMNELNVKVGDTVLCSGTCNSRYLAKVTKVTPTGRIKTDKTGSIQFDNHGYQMGSGSWDRIFISIPTDNDIKQLKEIATKRKAIHLMLKMHESNITVEQAEKVIEILEGGN
jgi:hypothetical protein